MSVISHTVKEFIEAIGTSYRAIRIRSVAIQKDYYTLMLTR